MNKTNRLLAVVATMVVTSWVWCATKSSKFEELSRPLDFYMVPKDVKQVLTKNELYQQINTRGVRIRIEKENYLNSLETYWQTISGYNLPRIGLTSSYRHSQSASAQSVSSISKNASLGIGLSGDTGWGLSYSIGLPTITHTLTDSLGSEGAFIASGTSSVALGITSVNFALLRDSVFVLGRNNRESADLTIQTARNSLRNTVLSAIQNSENAFYEVLLKQIRVQVLDLGFQSSQALLSDVREMVNAGEADRLSLLKTELQIAQSETDLLQARIELSNARQALRDLIALGVDENLELYPDPQELKKKAILLEVAPESAIARAKALRPDYLNAVLNRKSAELSVSKAFSAAMPKLDLSFSYGYTGSGSTFSQAKDDLMLFGPPTASVGLEFSYTFFNNSEQFAYRQSKFLLHRAEVQVEEALNQLVREINSAIISVEMGQRRLKTGEMSRQLAEKRLQSEFEKFRVGESNIRNVIDFQNEVNQGRITEIGARVDFMKSVTALRTAIGELPEGLSVSYSQ